jgi:hypothetical protein
VGFRAVLDAVVRRKSPAPAGTRTPDHPARSPAIYHNNDDDDDDDDDEAYRKLWTSVLRLAFIRGGSRFESQPAGWLS